MSPSTKKGRGKAEEKRREEKRREERQKCKKVRKDLLVQSKQTSHQPAARGRVFERRRVMKRRQEGAGELQILIYNPQRNGDWIMIHNKSDLNK